MNVDTLKLFPNQKTDGDFTECTALAVTDICGNMDGRPYDPDFTYAMTLKLQGAIPTTAGADPLSAMQSAIAYGLLPSSEQDFTALSMGELYVANWQNYSKEDIQSAFKYIKNGVRVLGADFQAIKSFIQETGTGVSISLRWYENFMTPEGGILLPPSGDFGYHQVVAYDIDERGLLIKPWLGPDYGDGGYARLSEDVFNQVVQNAYGFDKDALRWITLLGIVATRFPSFLPFLSGIISKNA